MIILSLNSHIDNLRSFNLVEKDYIFKRNELYFPLIYEMYVHRNGETKNVWMMKKMKDKANVYSRVKPHVKMM